MRRSLRLLLIIPAVLVLLIVLALGYLLIFVDVNAYKPQIEAAAQDALGRRLTLAGPIHLHLLPPSLALEDVSLANMPGGSRPDMLHVARAAGSLQLGPLLSGNIVISKLTLDQPDILLETDAAGAANWVFAKPARPAAAAPSAPAESAPKASSGGVDLRSLDITDARVTLRDGKANTTRSIVVPHLTITTAGAAAPLRIDLQAGLGSENLTLTGSVGAMSNLASGAPYPVDLQIGVAGAAAAIKGSIADPQHAAGYSFDVQVKIPDLQRVAALVPGAPGVPPLHDITLHTVLQERAGTPAPQLLDVQLGAADLSAIMAAFRLEAASIAAPQPESPVQVAAHGALGGKPWQFTATLNPLAELAAAREVQASALALSLPQGDLNGSAGVVLTGKVPAVTAKLRSTQLDADALQAALNGAVKPPAAASPAAPAARPAPAKPSQHVIPDNIQLPWDALAGLDATIDLGIATLRQGGADWHDLALRAVLADGVLTVDQADAITPAGKIAASGSADAVGRKLNVKLAAPAVNAGELPGLAGEVSGTASLDVSLAAAGATPHDLAASASGYAGISMQDGQLDQRLIPGFIDQVMQAARLGSLGGGRLAVRCLAGRLDLTNGAGTLRNMLLETDVMHIDGQGSLNLGNETLDLHLVPVAGLAGHGIPIPLAVRGSFRAPQVLPEINEKQITSGILGELTGQGRTIDCATALATARGAATPAPAPAPAAAKPAPLIPLLRGLPGIGR